MPLGTILISRFGRNRSNKCWFGHHHPSSAITIESTTTLRIQVRAAPTLNTNDPGGKLIKGVFSKLIWLWVKNSSTTWQTPSTPMTECPLSYNHFRSPAFPQRGRKNVNFFLTKRNQPNQILNEIPSYKSLRTQNREPKPHRIAPWIDSPNPNANSVFLHSTSRSRISIGLPMPFFSTWTNF